MATIRTGTAYQQRNVHGGLKCKYSLLVVIFSAVQQLALERSVFAVLCNLPTVQQANSTLQMHHNLRTIPLARTQPALDLDSLIGGFRPLFRALDPDQVNELSNQLLQALQGQGPTIGSFLDQAAAVTHTPPADGSCA